MIDTLRLAELIATHGSVARVVVADVKGSAPREVGASLLVWADGQEGTIGGGALEFQATAQACAQLGGPAARVSRAALGPALNQCCGGAVTLVIETFDVGSEMPAPGAPFARPVEPGASEMPGPIRRALDRARNLGDAVPLLMTGGWLLEPAFSATSHVVIYGAGHVGVALASLLNPFPDVDVTLADDRDRSHMEFIWDSYESHIGVAQALTGAPDDAHHLVMTHAHDLDLDLCHRLLGRPTGSIGLIGSATKWARFSKRLQALGHNTAAVSRITCPIGDPSLGKHPQAVALGVANDLLRVIKTPAARRKVS